MHRYRHEYKYVIAAPEASVLQMRSAGIMMRDAHVGNDGMYVVRSLYFDDFCDSCLRENLAGTDPRSKFRVRYYNNDTANLRLEKKSKSRMMTLKEGCGITRQECLCLMQGRIPQVTADMDETKKRLFLEMLLRGLQPKVIVTYERVPFVYPGGNVRVTFDKAITSSADIGSFLAGDYGAYPILPQGHSVLEVKWDELLPQHIKNSLKMDSLQWTAFSKYQMCRTHHL